MLIEQNFINHIEVCHQKHLKAQYMCHNSQLVILFIIVIVEHAPSEWLYNHIHNPSHTPIDPSAWSSVESSARLQTPRSVFFFYCLFFCFVLVNCDGFSLSHSLRHGCIFSFSAKLASSGRKLQVFWTLLSFFLAFRMFYLSHWLTNQAIHVSSRKYKCFEDWHAFASENFPLCQFNGFKVGSSYLLFCLRFLLPNCHISCATCYEVHDLLEVVFSVVSWVVS